MKPDVTLTTLECHRQIPAAPDEVYDVWIDATCPGGPWFAPTNERQTGKVILDAKVDGLFYHRVSVNELSFIHYGRFIELARGERVRHTWVCEATHGRESTVTTTFEAKAGGTLVTIVHEGVPDDDAGRHQNNGWKWALSALADSLTKRKNRAHQ